MPLPDGATGALGRDSSAGGTTADAARVCSVGTGAAEDSRDRLEQDPDIAAEGEVLHVVELDRQALGERQRPPTEDLHRARHPWLAGEPEATLGTAALDQHDLLR